MEYKQIKETADFLKGKGFIEPDTGIVLGTGLGSLVDSIQIEVELPYEDIPHFPVATVEFHKGKLIYGTLSGKKVVVMQGRFHYYEGYSMQEIVFPIQVLKLLGVSELLISNAAGAINKSYKKGSLMLIDDHINLLPDNPLRGKNIDELGNRFPDMSAPYSKQMNTVFEEVAKQEDIQLHKGVYASVMGPNLETRAEYRFLGTIGADAVGMSTVPEVIAAKHMSLPTIAISVLTDECDPDNLQVADINEIIAIAGKAEKKLVRLFEAYLSK